MKFSELMERVRRRGVAVSEVRAGAGGDPEVLGVCEDSRKVKPGDVFVARGGTKVDGAKFVADAVAKGAVGVVGENGKLKIENSKIGEVAWAEVEDVNLACAVLAHEVAGNPTAGMKMIGITGTKGKTTVAYLLRSVLKAAGHRVGMIGTVEIDDGASAVPAEMTTPGSVELVELFSRMKANGVTHCVMEVSSHALHQQRVAGIDWDVAIFTNLTGDHLDYHGTMEEYAAAKAMLFEGLKKGTTAVVNCDDKWGQRIIHGCKAGIWLYGLGNRDAQWDAGIQGMTSESMRIAVSGYDRIQERTVAEVFETPLIGRHNAYNMLSVIVAAADLGVPCPLVIQTLAHAKGAPGRLQRVSVEGVTPPFQVFVDYAHTHDALENVLKSLRMTMGKPVELAPGEVGPTWQAFTGTLEHNRTKLICVFGCGGDRDRTKRPKMGAVAERLADQIIITNDNPRTENSVAIAEEICAGLSTGWQQGDKMRVQLDRRVAIRAAIGMARPGDVVLLAGKGHENYQIIGTTKHHFDDVEEAEAAMRDILKHESAKTRSST